MLPGDQTLLRQRKLHVGCKDAIAADDHAQIVQRAVRPEDRPQQPAGDLRVQTLAALDQTAETDAPLDCDQGADLALGEKLRRFGHRLHDAVDPTAGAAKQPGMAEPNHELPQLRLEDHDKENGQETEEPVIDEVQSVLAEHLDGDRYEHQQDREPLDDPRPPRPFQESDDQEHAQPDDCDLDEDLMQLIAAKDLKDAGHEASRVPPGCKRCLFREYIGSARRCPNRHFPPAHGRA